MMARTTIEENRQHTWLGWLNGPLHERVLWLFMVIVLGHWLEHLLQVYQVYVLAWTPKQAGGALGLTFPALVESEVLHFTYNFLLWAGIWLMRPAFAGRARFWWTGALALQSWHFFEHLLLQVQWLTGIYLFGAPAQTSLLQLWFPRVELHFMYNLLVFVPMVLGMVYHFYPPAPEPVHRGCTCDRRRGVAPSDHAAKST
jgi:hypothetical protein